MKKDYILYDSNYEEPQILDQMPLTDQEAIDLNKQRRLEGLSGRWIENKMKYEEDN